MKDMFVSLLLCALLTSYFFLSFLPPIGKKRRGEAKGGKKGGRKGCVEALGGGIMYPMER